MSPGDAILLQNEINAMPEIIRAAAKAKLKIFLNPAPMGPEVKSYPLALVSCLVVNEIEGEELSGEKAPERSISKLRKLYPNTEIMLTLGSKGARLEGPEGSWQVDAVKAKAVDTTAAGDTFIGYYLAGLAEGLAKPEAMKLAVKAAALTVSRKGAAESIPFRGELV
jgi:ribokinase